MRFLPRQRHFLSHQPVLCLWSLSIPALGLVPVAALLAEQVGAGGPQAVRPTDRFCPRFGGVTVRSRTIPSRSMCIIKL